MSVERTLFAFGGTMVMLTSLLALFHHPNWTWVTLFIGFNCLQSSKTGHENRGGTRPGGIKPQSVQKPDCRRGALRRRSYLESGKFFCYYFDLCQ
jgi:hypothetical protein